MEEQPPTIQQTNHGAHSVQVCVGNGNVYITQASSDAHGRVRSVALLGVALSPISAGIALSHIPVLSLGLLGLGAAVALLSAPTWFATSAQAVPMDTPMDAPPALEDFQVQRHLQIANQYDAETASARRQRLYGSKRTRRNS